MHQLGGGHIGLVQGSWVKNLLVEEADILFHLVCGNKEGWKLFFFGLLFYLMVLIAFVHAGVSRFPSRLVIRIQICSLLLARCVHFEPECARWMHTMQYSTESIEAVDAKFVGLNTPLIVSDMAGMWNSTVESDDLLRYCLDLGSTATLYWPWPRWFRILDGLVCFSVLNIKLTNWICHWRACHATPCREVTLLFEQ